MRIGVGVFVLAAKTKPETSASLDETVSHPVAVRAPLRHYSI
jgi:hypothetical protein